MVTPKRPKPDKPYPEFPLFAHLSGQWARKVKGRTRYFGPWGDPQGSLEKYRRQIDDLQAGRVPRERPADGPSLRDLANAFLTSKTHRLQTGELAQRTFNDYKRTTDTLIAHFGRERLLSDITPGDFQKLRAWYAAGDDGTPRGLVAIANFVRMVRIFFKYGYDSDLLDRPVKFGPDFKLPSRKSLEIAKAGRPKRLFAADEIRQMVDAADPQLKAAILLGINAAYGPTDLSRLPQSALDLDGGWLEFPRPKTASPRRAKLWPETVAALREVIDQRPKPASDLVADRVFLTRFGRQLVRTSSNGTHIDSLGMMFGRLLNELKMKRVGVAFYSLRHTFRTIADETLDQPAADLVMGHSPPSQNMAAKYREVIGDDRLERIASHVHDWLWSPKKKPAPKRAAGK